MSPPPRASSSTQQTSTRVEEIHHDSKQPKWSVSYNSRIKQALHIDLDKTFAFTSMVFCVKFSPDGKYLAVGLCSGNGKTYLYDVETGLKIWLATLHIPARPHLTFRTSCLVDLYLKNQPLVWCVQFSPDSKYIAIASGKQIRVCILLFRVPTIDLSLFLFYRSGKLHENEREPCCLQTQPLSIFPPRAISLSQPGASESTFGLFVTALPKRCGIMSPAHSQLHSVQTDDISRLWILIAGSEYGMRARANFWIHGRVTLEMGIVWRSVQMGKDW